jgi:hypothetical protein
VTSDAAPPASVKLPVAGDPIVDAFTGDVIVTAGAESVLNDAVCVAAPAALLAVTLKVCGPSDRAGLVCGLGHGLTAGNASHWQLVVVAVPPAIVYVPVAGDPIVEPFVGLVITTVSVNATVNELVTVVDPAMFEAVTENVCAPTESAGLVCGLVHELIGVSASH